MIIKDGNFTKSGKIQVSGHFFNEFIKNPLMAKRFFEKLIILKCEYDPFNGSYTYFCYSHYFQWKERGKEPPIYEVIVKNIENDYEIKFKKIKV